MTLKLLSQDELHILKTAARRGGKLSTDSLSPLPLHIAMRLRRSGYLCRSKVKPGLLILTRRGRSRTVT